MQGIQFSANSSLTERVTLGNKLAIMQVTVKVFVLNVTWEHGCGDVTVHAHRISPRYREGAARGSRDARCRENRLTASYLPIP